MIEHILMRFKRGRKGLDDVSLSRHPLISDDLQELLCHWPENQNPKTPYEYLLGELLETSGLLEWWGDQSQHAPCALNMIPRHLILHQLEASGTLPARPRWHLSKNSHLWWDLCHFFMILIQGCDQWNSTITTSSSSSRKFTVIAFSWLWLQFPTTFKVSFMQTFTMRIDHHWEILHRRTKKK